MCTLDIHIYLLFCYRFVVTAQTRWIRFRNEESTVAPVTLTINGVKLHPCLLGMELST